MPHARKTKSKTKKRPVKAKKRRTVTPTFADYVCGPRFGMSGCINLDPHCL